MKKDYQKAFELMQETVECIETENLLLVNRLRYIEYFLEKFGHELPNGKQEISCYKVIDVLKDIIHGDISIDFD